MAGKPYGMREMKAIVDYLNEHKAYGEVKGRKMWMDFANSRLTDRTWQSLKETFLKRILPDIQNPYYKLTLHEVRSFRMGRDVLPKDKNKLEILKENNSDRNAAGKDQDSSTSRRAKAEIMSGEDNNPSKIQQQNRDSVDTVKIRTDSDLEINENETSTRKSCKDFIIYDEPLTPALEQVLHDFATSSDEDSLKIFEPQESNPEKKSNSTPILVQDSESVDRNKTDNNTQPCNTDGVTENSTKEIRKSPRKKNTEVTTKSDTEKTTDNIEKSKLYTSEQLEQPHSGQTTIQTPDSFLPNNQEGIIFNDAKIRTTESLTENSSRRILRKKGTLSDDMHSNSKSSLKPRKNLRKHSTSSDIVFDKKHIQKRQRKNTEITSEAISEIPKSVEDNSVKESFKKVAASNQNDHETPSQTSDLTQESTEDFVTTKRNGKNTTEIITTAQVHVVNGLKSPSKNTKKSEMQALSVKHQQNEDGVDITAAHNPNEIKNDNHNSSKENHDPLDVVKETNSLSSQKVNPCLESVSLYAEQLSPTTYNSEDSDAKETVIVETAADNLKNKQVNKLQTTEEKKDRPVDKEKIVNNKIVTNHENTIKDVVLLKSNSESSELEQHNTNKKRLMISKSRERLLDNMFGFSGGPGHGRKRRLSAHRRNSRSSKYVRYAHEEESASSEWTSESDSEFMSPPPRSRPRNNVRIRNPKMARLVSLKDEGGLIVIDKKHVYPVVRDERKSTKTLTYLPDSDEEDSFWKMKYIEEKKKAAELAKRLELAEEKSNKRQGQNEVLDLTRDDVTEAKESRFDKKSSSASDKVTIMFKTANKNVPEIQLEGKWQTLHHVVEDLRSMFAKESELSAVDTSKTNSSVADNAGFKSPQKSKLSLKRDTRQNTKMSTLKVDSKEYVELINSRSTTPDDPVVHEKVSKIESEIFKQIQESEKQTEDQEEHVTLRRRERPPKSAKHSPEKKPRRSDSSNEQTDEDNKLIRLSKGEVVEASEQKSPSKQKTETTAQTQEKNKAKTRSVRTTSLAESIKSIASSINEQTDEEKKINRGRKAKNKVTSEAKTEETISPRSTEITSNRDIKHSLVLSKNKDEPRTPQRTRNQLKVTSDSDSKSPKTRKLAVDNKDIENVTTRTRSARTAVETDSRDEASSNKRKRLANVARRFEGQVNEMEIPEITMEGNSTEEDDSQPRYKLPSPPPDTSVVQNKSNNDMKTMKYKSVFSSPEDNLSRHSVESTQGYQDSDASFILINDLRRKRKYLTTFTHKGQFKTKRRKRRSYPIARTDLSDSSDSGRSFASLPVKVKSMTINNSSLINAIDSYVYKSESYQLLMAKTNKVQTLEKIDESNLENANEKNTVEIEVNISNPNKDENISEINTEAGHSSNVSLPVSPELSIVENLTANKNVLSSVDDYISLNEIQVNEEIKLSPEEKFAISSVDVTMPLMEQLCDVEKIPQVMITPKIRQLRSSSGTPKITVSALIDKIGNVDLDELTLSDSLQQGLLGLVIESAKKLSRKAKTDSSVKKSEKEVKKQIASKKRCSTPHKRQIKRKQAEGLEAECMEYCSSITSQKSCTKDIPTDEINNNNNTSSDKSERSTSSTLSKGKKKKDVIKVKIQRPSKSLERKCKHNLDKSTNSAITTCVNDTESGILVQEADDSVDLIHNHSETCLLANDCINDDSVQIIEKSRTAISLDSYSLCTDESLPKDKDGQICGDLFCSNAQDATVSQSSIAVVKVGTAISSQESETFETASQATTTYHSPQESPDSSQEKNLANSLITEDMSDNSTSPPHSSKWYLLSDEETTNTNIPNTVKTSIHSNLQKLFPVACAVPDLSTITENSEDSRKAIFVEDKNNNSPGVVDMNE